jgi:sec-independent protein translocase protein TatC
MSQTSHNDAPEDDNEQGFISHLLELRDRLLRMVLALLVVFIILFPFANDIYTYLAKPLLKSLPSGEGMIAVGIIDPFLIPLKLAFAAALFIVMPYILYELWRFIAPGLYRHERRLALPIVASSVVLFYTGVLFAYYVVFPLVFEFLANTAPAGVDVKPDIGYYLSFAITIFFAFGLAFEIPIATFVLVLMGVTTPDKLVKKRPYIIVGAFVIGMLLTPPDAISQTLLAIPMWLLFEIGVIFSRAYIKKRPGQEEESIYAEADDDIEEGVVSASSGSGVTAPVTPQTGDFELSGDDTGEGDYKPMSEEEMDAELDRIDAEMEELGEMEDEDKPEDSDKPGGNEQDKKDKPAGDNKDSGKD